MSERKGAPRCARVRGLTGAAGRVAGFGRAVLDSAPLPARSFGRRGYAPRPSAGCWGNLCVLGHAATAGSPPARVRLAWEPMRLRGLRAASHLPHAATRPGSPTSSATRLRLRASGLRITLGMTAHRSRPTTATTAPSPYRVSDVLPDCPAQSNATLHRPASPTRSSALRTYSPGPPRGCGFRARPCWTSRLALRSAQGETLRKYGGTSNMPTPALRPETSRAGSTSWKPVSFKPEHHECHP